MTKNGINGNGEGWTSWTLERAKPSMILFIECLRDKGNVRSSCEAAGLPRSTAYYWRERFATFRNEWNDAMEDACDILEGEAWRRGIEEDSDRLLMFLLKAHRREVFGDHTRLEHQGEVKTVVQVIGGVDFAQVLPPMPQVPDEDVDA